MADDEDTSAPAQVPEVDEVPLYEGDSGAVTTTEVGEIGKDEDIDNESEGTHLRTLTASSEFESDENNDEFGEEFVSTAPPSPTRTLYMLYTSSLLSAWGDRMWEFAVPIILTTIFTDTILPASAFPFVTQLACVLFGTLVGKLVDDANRKWIITLGLSLQNVCVGVCSVLLYFIQDFKGPTAPFLTDYRFLMLFTALVALGSIAALASMAESIAVGRDWVIVIAGNNSDVLADANAMMTRISLICKVAAPVLFGVVLYVSDIVAVLLFVGLWNIISLAPELLLLIRIYNKIPALQQKIQSSQDANACLTIWSGWSEYIQSKKTFLPSFAYVLLYLTALSPGALMSAWLLTYGINEIYISAYQAVSAIVGVIATFLAPKFMKLWGMEWTGLYSIWFQQGWLVLGLLCFFLPLLPIASIPELVIKGAVWGFLGCLIMSRVSLWSFDLAERQIMQEFVPEEKRGIINSVEFSLTNVFSLLSYFLGVVWSRPEQFGVIVIISFTSVTLAAVFYSLWMYCVRPRVVQEQNAPVREDEEAFL